MKRAWAYWLENWNELSLRTHVLTVIVLVSAVLGLTATFVDYRGDSEVLSSVSSVLSTVVVVGLFAQIASAGLDRRKRRRAP